MVRPDAQRKRDGLRCGDSEAQRRLGKRSGRKSGRERSGRKGDNPDRAYGPVAENCTAVFFLICAVVKSDVQQAPSLFFTCTVTDGSASKYSVALSVGGSVKFVVSQLHSHSGLPGIGTGFGFELWRTTVQTRTSDI